MQGPRDSESRRRGVRVIVPLIAAMVALALVIGLWAALRPARVTATSSPTTASSSAPTQSPTVPTDEVTVQVTVADGGVAELADGSRVVIPPGAVTHDARLTLSRMRSGAPTVPSGLVSAAVAGPLWVGLGGGRLTGTAELTLPASVPAGWPSDLAFDPWLAFYDEVIGDWSPAVGAYDATRGLLTVEVEHFSWWNPFSWDYGAIKDSIVQSLADMAGAPSGIPPTCANPPAASDVLLAAEGEAVADTCLDTDDDAVVLRMRGTKHYPLLVTWSGQASLVARAEYGLDVTSLYRWLAARLELTATDAVVLPSGGDVHLAVRPDATAPVLVTASYDPQLQLVGIVDATTHVIMAVRGATGVQTTAEEVWEAVKDSGCFIQHVDDLARDAAGASVTIIADCAGNVLRELSQDSPRLVLRVAGATPKVIGSFVGVVLYAGHAVLSEFYAGYDVLTGVTTEFLTISTPESPPADSGDGPDSLWPVGDNEGPSALWVWFGASFVFPDWVSCDDAGAWCIAGIGREVHAYRLDGLVDAASVPLASIDPAGALTSLGLQSETVAQLLRAG